MNNFSSQNWLDYISKLNDRYINKKSSSGFTLWAILGLVGYLSYNIIDNLKFILMDSNYISILVLFTCLLNLFVFGYHIFSVTSTTTSSGSSRNVRRLITNLQNKLYRITISQIYIFFTVGFIANLFVILTLSSLPKLPFLLLCLYYIVNLIAFAIFQKTSSNNEMKEDNLKLQPFFINFTSHKNFFYSGLVFGLIFFSLSLYGFITTFHILNISDNIYLLKLSLNILILFLSIFVYYFIYLDSIRYEWLEEFERRIIMEDLSSSQICELFIKEFVGRDIYSFLNSIDSQIITRYADFINTIDEFNTHYNNAVNNDIDVQVKYVININDITSKYFVKVTDAIDSYLDFSEQQAKCIKSFQMQGPFSSDEINIINIFIDRLNNRYDSVRAKYDEAKIKCDNALVIYNNIKSSINN